MALNLVSPGVKVREVDLTVGRIEERNLPHIHMNVRDAPLTE